MYHFQFPSAPPHLSVKDVCVVVDIVGQEVGLGAHQQHVPRGVGPQLACRQTGDGLVDVEQGDVRVLGAVGQPVGRRPRTPDVRVVDEDLGQQESSCCRWCFIFLEQISEIMLDLPALNSFPAYLLL